MIMIKKSEQSFFSSRFVWPWSQHASLEVHVMWTESNKYVCRLKEKYLRNNCRNTCVTCYGAGWQRVKWSGSSKHVCQLTPILCRWQVVIQKTLISGGDDQDEDENLHFQAKEQKHNWWKSELCGFETFHPGKGCLCNKEGSSQQYHQLELARVCITSVSLLYVS